jgi:hypothetical protein
VTEQAIPRRPTRRWSRALVGVTVLVTLVLVGCQMAASFLYNAPADVISKAYAAQVSWWMTPLQMQNWQLFAPNPISENVEVDARASVGPSAAVTSWVNLSAIDEAQTDGDPAPSHLTMNAMRNAWIKFVQTHTSTGIPLANSPLAGTAQGYLENLVLTYLRPHESQTIDSVQVRFVTTLLSGEGRTAAQTAPQTATMPWWPVTPS